jgi:hypothetical protein
MMARSANCQWPLRLAAVTVRVTGTAAARRSVRPPRRRGGPITVSRVGTVLSAARDSVRRRTRTLSRSLGAPSQPVTRAQAQAAVSR